MNWITTMPDIPDTWKGGMTEACKVLGKPGRPINLKTLARYCSLGVRYGGIDYKMGRSGRKFFTGKEIKRFWLTL